jgi:polyhydroxybutyrate depolymerase
MHRSGWLAAGLCSILGACAGPVAEGAAERGEGSSSADDGDSGSGETSSVTVGSGGTAGAEEGGEVGGHTDDSGGMIACPPATFEPGTHSGLELEHDGRTRSYDLYVPPSYDGATRVPLVFNIHGLTSDPAQQAWFSQMNDTADEEGFVVVYPAGVGNSWNAGACCGYAKDEDIDDVAFVRALAEQLQAELCVDADRTYATGMSNGGFLSHRLACEAADVFAAIAPVAGVLGLEPDDCQPARPIPVMHFHGTADTLVPYDGSLVLGFMSVPESFASWAEINGCTGDPKITFEQGDVTCETFDSCDAAVEVTLCTIAWDAHCWPGNPVCPFGKSTTEIHASVAGAEFFARWSL